MFPNRPSPTLGVRADLETGWPPLGKVGLSSTRPRPQRLPPKPRFTGAIRPGGSARGARGWGRGGGAGLEGTYDDVCIQASGVGRSYIQDTEDVRASDELQEAKRPPLPPAAISERASSVEKFQRHIFEPASQLLGLYKNEKETGILYQR